MYPIYFDCALNSKRTGSAFLKVDGCSEIVAILGLLLLFKLLFNDIKKGAN
ncbi:hypothetical protein D3C86_916220 [compost metagenome]